MENTPSCLRDALATRGFLVKHAPRESIREDREQARRHLHAGRNRLNARIHCGPIADRGGVDELNTQVTSLGRTSWPVSRILFRSAGFRRGGGDHPSGHTVTGCLERPTRRLGRAALERLRSRTGVRPLGLASGGVYRAIPVTRDAGALLPHRFTLTAAPENFGGGGGLFSVALSRESPRIAVGNHPAL